MSRSIAVALLLSSVAAAAGAQSRAGRGLETLGVSELRVLLARADSQLAYFEMQRQARERAEAPRYAGRLTVAGDVALVTWHSVNPATAQAVVRGADSALRRSNVIPPEFTRRFVFIMAGTTDTATALADPEVAGRQRALLSPLIGQQGSSGEGALPADPRHLLSQLARRFESTLDSSWAAWLWEWDALTRPPHELVEPGMRDLAEPRFAVAGRCLAGNARGCRLFLGLDADAHPYRDRYSPAELRAFMSEWYRPGPDASACIGGDDGACVRAAEGDQAWQSIDVVPATYAARSSLLASVAALHGSVVLRRALADSAGSLGNRLERAIGIGTDSLVLEWRSWVLSGGRPGRVSAGLGDALAALAAIGLLVLISTRSGRWR